MRGAARWYVAMGALGGVVAGCHGAPWQHAAPTPQACVQRSAMRQEIARLETKLKKGDFPATPPVLVAASAAGGSGSAGGPMGGSAQGLALEKRAEAASAPDGGASPQASSKVALAKATYDMDENAALERKAVANVAGINTAGSAVVPATVSAREAGVPAPTTKAQAQARIRVLQKQLWDLPSGSSCAKLNAGASAAN